jgi:hypothetical protein
MGSARIIWKVAAGLLLVSLVAAQAGTAGAGSRIPTLEIAG